MLSITKFKLAALMLIIAVGISLNNGFAQSMEKTKIHIASHPFWVEVAETPEQQMRGLQNRKNLPEGKGMMFPIEVPQPMSFWMKDCEIPLDILYFSKGRLVYFVDNVPPCHKAGPDCPTYTSPVSVDNIVELKAGTRKKLKIQSGARLTLK